MATHKRRSSDEHIPQVLKKARFALRQDDEDAPDHGSSIADSTTSPSPQSTPQQFTAPATSVTSRSRSSRRSMVHFCTFDGCSKVYDRPNRLAAHVRTHTGDRPFVCKADGCTKSFFKNEHLKAHIHNNHNDGGEEHVCTYTSSTNANGEEVRCGKAFSTATRLKRHVAAHQKKEELKCTEVGCGMVFRKMETLQRHIRKEHLHENEFRCSKIVHDVGDGRDGEVCGQTFATISNLKSHERLEHRGLTHFCSACSPSDDSERVGFQTYAEFQAHNKAVHPPTCAMCDRSFPSAKALTAHMDIEHTSSFIEQQYPCMEPGCDRSFNRKGNLKVHIQNVHAKTSKFVCGVTDLSFDDKCPGWDGQGCGLRFATKASLEDHVRTQHLDLPTIRKRRNAVKIKDEEGDPETLMELDQHSDNMSGAGSNPLSLLTGYNYADARPIACWTSGCPVRFSREYDLAQHMWLTHGLNVDDINDRLVEEEALGGERFWLGGIEEAEVGDVSFVDFMDRVGENYGFADMPMDGLQQLEVQDTASFMPYEQDRLLLDPALAGL